MKQSTRYADVSERAGGAAPRGAALAIRFMQRNLARPFAIREMAAAAGTPERTLRRQFQRFTGQSPIAFHRHLRLEAAHQALRDNHSEIDITTAAGMHGFSHLSHFTSQYQRRYGELPSATLRATRESTVPLLPHTICNPVIIIVFPFTCANAESSTELTGTTTDRVISALTRTRRLNVLSPDSHLPAADNIQIASSYARYAVRGRVQCIGGRVQTVVRLVDLATGRQIWGNAFEGTTERAIELQQHVAEAVASALPASLRDTQATHVKRKPERDPVAVHCATAAYHAVLDRR
jgi:AraC-like DNA-binding protein